MYLSFKEKQKKNFIYRKILLSKPTRAELAFKSLLEELKVHFIFQKGFIAKNGFCIVDFYLPKPNKICFEIDGDYHKNNAVKDNYKNYYLRSVRRMRVIRYNNHDVLERPEWIKDQLIQILNKLQVGEI